MKTLPPTTVIPAKAGIQKFLAPKGAVAKIPSPYQGEG